MASMYKVKPIFVANQVTDLPTCMYQMKNLHGTPENVEFLSPANGPTIVQLNESKHGSRERTPSEVAKLEAVQEDILLKLNNLKSKLDELRKLVKEPVTKAPTKQQQTTLSTAYDFSKVTEAVVAANPSNPPYALLALQKIWSPEIDVSISTYSHSSLKPKVPKTLNDLFNTSSKLQGVPTLMIRIIWTPVKQTQIITSPAKQIICSEVNILRLLSRFGPPTTNIDSLSAEEAASVDQLLDLLHGAALKNGSSSFISKLAPEGPDGWLLKKGPSIADFALWSYLKNEKSVKCSGKLATWQKKCDKLFN
ncbi:aminoacyl tRNA synthase complex-interacting multifunctional protein 2 [Neocloeon triangulifer]|uniref:aminoacyl tRNA synthase complex-interacting multifunctional protein 2 n=1 Tax=Neocloeon triangulifer TaxID=2078957 RepID=UPI00286EE0F6|nr:aminoacyl tRNA synthase complex-interacting multifunctional protein 2 [Neocloeon triangulifer]